MLGFCGCDNKAEDIDEKIVHPYMVYVIGEVDSVIKEEVPILDTYKYKIAGYKIKTLIPCSEDFSEGDEFTIYSYFQRRDINNEPSELCNGDLVIVSYFVESHKIVDGENIINDGVIQYASIDNLSKFEKITDGKVQDLMKQYNIS